MLDTTQQAGLFLINVFFDLYLMVLMLRFTLCLVRADYYNPVTQFVVKLTHPIISPLRRIIPIYANIELPTLFLIILLAMLKFFLLCVIALGWPKNFLGLLILSCADSFKLFLNLFFYAILLNAVLTWIQQGYSPLGQLLSQLTSPIIRPIQRIMPPMGGIDLSPIPALILLQLSSIILVNPALSAGWSIALG